MVVKMGWRLCCVILIFCVSGTTLLELNDESVSRVPMSMPPLFALDQHAECLSQGSLYCLLKMELFDNRQNPLMDMIHKHSNYAGHYNYTNIDRGVCVETTCRNFIHGYNLAKAEELAMVLEACLNKSIWNDYGVQAKLAFVYNCDSANEIDAINAVDWTVAAVCGLMVVAIVVGSCYDYYVDDDRGNKYLLSFSIMRNWKALLSSNSSEKGISLQGFHGVRALFSLLVILEHVILLYAGGFQSNPSDFENAFESASYKTLFNGLTIVQAYFFISGFLLTCNLHIQAEKRPVSMAMVPLIIVLRLSRLVPAYAVMLAVSATWLRHLGSGPLWKYYITNTVVADCRRYWWHHLLFIQTYFPQYKFCAGQTWHLSVDMQLFIVGLVVCVATMRGGRARALAVLFAAGSVAPALNVWLWDLDGIPLMRPESYKHLFRGWNRTRNLLRRRRAFAYSATEVVNKFNFLRFWRTLNEDTFWCMHILAHNNLPAFVIGMALAKLVYDKRMNNVHSSKLKILTPLMWLTIPAALFLFHWPRVMYEQERVSLWLRMLLPCLQRVAMAALSAVFTAGLVLKPRYTSAVRGAFEWTPWVVPSRLSYCVFLLHMHLINMMLGARLQLTGITFLHTFVWYLGVVFLSYLMAVPLYLTVEAPVNNICKNILKKFDTAVKDVKQE